MLPRVDPKIQKIYMVLYMGVLGGSGVSVPWMEELRIIERLCKLC